MTVLLQSVFALDSISNLKWDNRIILVFSPSDHSNYTETLRGAHEAILDRDIYWFVFSNQGIDTNYPENLDEDFLINTKERYMKDNQTHILLIGKDGYIKENTDNLNLQNLFDLIDSMPMRQIEMQN